MRAGQLNTKILIESKTNSIDGVGENIETWSTFADVYANVQTKSGREFIHASAQNAELSHVVTVRYLTGLTSEMRINNGGSYLNILSVFDPDGKKREMKAHCNEQL